MFQAEFGPALIQQQDFSPADGEQMRRLLQQALEQLLQVGRVELEIEYRQQSADGIALRRDIGLGDSQLGLLLKPVLRRRGQLIAQTGTQPRHRQRPEFCESGMDLRQRHAQFRQPHRHVVYLLPPGRQIARARPGGLRQQHLFQRAPRPRGQTRVEAPPPRRQQLPARLQQALVRRHQAGIGRRRRQNAKMRRWGCCRTHNCP